ncbi:hypothetical protein [Nonomuraea rhizosphaerae]|uniref:hypothetical protein n=1 Tax=Nonomuraea rhizosphaerae TaxID=2665663 RepID=UPI001C5DDD1D|nr:hypothetical protein [Nonomuraea rhizosphaerae]
MYVDTDGATSAANGMAAGADSLTGSAGTLRSVLAAIGSLGNEGSALTVTLDEFASLLTEVAERTAHVRGSVADGMGESVAAVLSADTQATPVPASGDRGDRGGDRAGDRAGAAWA